METQNNMGTILDFFRGLILYYTYNPSKFYVNGKRVDLSRKPIRIAGHRIREWLASL